jgi:hypothetical protein
VRKPRGRGVRGQGDGPSRDHRISNPRWQNSQEAVGIVQGAVVFVEYLNPGYDSPGVMRAQRVRRTRRSKREAAASIVDPEIQARLTRLGDDV